MNGFEFYHFLFQNLVPGQMVSHPNGNNNVYNFIQWIGNDINDMSLQFDMHNGNIKSIPRNIIELAKEAFNADQDVIINGPWLIQNEYNRGSCAASVLRFLLETYQD
ncbi:MAG TPA: hypothetical protein VIM55_05130 [Mucilaginibacter sp.]